MKAMLGHKREPLVTKGLLHGQLFTFKDCLPCLTSEHVRLPSRAVLSIPASSAPRARCEPLSREMKKTQNFVEVRFARLSEGSSAGTAGAFEEHCCGNSTR